MLTLVGLTSQLLGFFSRVAIARFAGAQVLGLYQLILPAYGAAQALCVSGPLLAVAVLTARYDARKNTGGMMQVLHTALKGFFILWLIPALAVLAGRDLIAGRLLGDPRTAAALPLLLPTLLLTGVENLHKHHLYARGEVKIPALVELGEQSLRALAMAALLYFAPDAAEEAALQRIITALLISEVFSASSLVLYVRSRGLHSTSVKGLWRQGASIALPVLCSAVAGNLLNLATNVAIPRLLMAGGLNRSAAMEDFGVMLGMTLPLLCLPTAFISALSLPLLPRLTGELERGRMDRFCRTGEKALLAVSYLLLPLLALLCALGDTLGEVVFHHAGVGSHVLPLAIGVGAGCYQSIAVCLLNALGKQGQWTVCSLVQGCAELALTLVLLPKFGLWGFAWGHAAVSLAGLIGSLMLVFRHCALCPRLYACFTAPFLSALAGALAVRLGSFYLPFAGLRYTLWGLCLGLGVYLLCMLAQGVPPLRWVRS